MDGPKFGKLISVPYRSYGFAFIAAQEGWKVTSALLPCWMSLLQGTCNTWKYSKLGKQNYWAFLQMLLQTVLRQLLCWGAAAAQSVVTSGLSFALYCCFYLHKVMTIAIKWSLIEQKKNHELKWDIDCLCKKIQHSLRRVCFLKLMRPTNSGPNQNILLVIKQGTAVQNDWQHQAKYFCNFYWMML